MKDLTDVKKIRTTLGMSQKQLADALGMSLRSVAAWEAGATVTPSVIKMLQQLLAGINLADLFRLTPADIAGGRLRYRRQKTGKQIDRPLTAEAVDLLERMKGERLLVAICERYANVHSFTISANRGFGKLRPGLTSYWARHSWASIAVNVCGIAVEVVGRALGHSVGQRVTLIYARLDTAHVDAAVVAVSRAVGE